MNYYYNDFHKVEAIQTSDGTEFDYTKIELMIQAMASFNDLKRMMTEAVNQNMSEQANDASKDVG